MPNYTRPPNNSLPDIDEAVSPLRTFFAGNTGFDFTTIEATTQHAHSSIFIGPNGQRFMVQRLDDTAQGATGQPAPSPVQTVPASNSYSTYGTNNPISPLTPSSPSGSSEAQSLNARSIRRRPVQQSGGGTPPTPAVPAAASTYQAYHPAAGSSVNERLAAAFQVQGQGQPGPSGSSAEPKVPTQDVAAGMLGNLNIPRFGADPLYGHSDGGAQAATALTDRHPGQHQQQQPGMVSPPQHQSQRPVMAGQNFSPFDHMGGTGGGNGHGYGMAAGMVPGMGTVYGPEHAMQNLSLGHGHGQASMPPTPMMMPQQPVQFQHQQHMQPVPPNQHHQQQQYGMMPYNAGNGMAYMAMYQPVYGMPPQMAPYLQQQPQLQHQQQHQQYQPQPQPQHQPPPQQEQQQHHQHQHHHHQHHPHPPLPVPPRVSSNNMGTSTTVAGPSTAPAPGPAPSPMALHVRTPGLPSHRTSIGLSSTTDSTVPSLAELPTPVSARGSMNLGHLSLASMMPMPPMTASSSSSGPFGQHGNPRLIPLAAIPAEGHDEKIVHVGGQSSPPSQRSPSTVMVHVQPPSTIATPSDAGSTTNREGVMPGEDLLYDGKIKFSHYTQGPFEDAHLWVFRNNQSNDLRFHCKTMGNSETCWAKGAKAQVVPVYAYDQRSSNLVYVRDENEASANASATTRPNGIYQFPELDQLFSFQGRLTGENVIFDISTVRWVKLAKVSGRTSETHSAARLQIWHEPRVRHANASDAASIITAGTALSGPIRDRVVANTSRLMVFLGRSETYMMVFVTEDVELKIEDKKPTLVKLRPRKYGGLHLRTPRAGIKGHLEERKGSEPAGLDIHGQALNIDLEESFNAYKTFEIEFETENGQSNFLAAWNEVVDARRKQRMKLTKISETMEKETYSAAAALAVRT